MYDYHTHSTFSADGDCSMDEMIRAAIRLGLSEIAVTDHHDPEYSDLSWYVDLDIPAYESTLDAAAAKYADSIRVVRGIEIGMQQGIANLDSARVVKSYPFDFVIGSIHSASGYAVDTPPYLGVRDRRAAVRDYYMELILCLKEFDDFDVIGHFNFIDRYIDSIPPEDEYWDLAEEALRLIVSMGKGIEINTSAWRFWHGSHHTPTARVLKRYVELGGETVTTGSDAHDISRIGSHLKEAEEMAAAAGLRYIATFKDRSPSYVKL
ncbi:MAG: histidinol-phosphatase HisJ family protein [Clostridiales Family XIII bacterium]|jgi:histidinol-phosphatase (PHP family)|nr:histidinol-phosphatase HisJ family protein [Clostridiales Family XIII bacterium]